MENLEEKKIDDILKDIHNDFMDYFENIDIPKEGSTSFHDLNNKISIYELENNFHQSINLVRESLTKFKDICLTNEKDKKKKDLTLRKLSLILKEQNRNRQISKEWNSTCSDCLESLRQVCKIDKFQIMKKSLIELADVLKLEHFCDSYAKGLSSERISIYGKVIVIDIAVLLKNNLRENNIQKFYEILSNLAYLDKYSNGDYDLFHNIQCIENTLTSLYEAESKNRTIPDVIQYGHGYPLISVSRFGPSSIYWGTPSALRQINWSEFSKAEDEEKATIMNLGFYKANISIINTKGNSFFLTTAHKNYIKTDNDMTEDGVTTSIVKTPLSEFQFITSIKDLKPLNGKTYCLTLDPPIIATTEMENLILNVLHANDEPDKKYDFVDNNIQMFNSQLFKNSQLYIENLLIYDKFCDNFSSMSDLSEINKSFYIKKNNMYPQQYMFNDSNVHGIVVRHIPFTDPSQIYSIYKILRQQLVFNTLFQSCMDSNNKNEDPTKPIKNYLEEFHIILEVYCPNAPNEITIIFNHPSKPGIINVTITIPLDNPEKNLKVHYNEKSLLDNDMSLPTGFGDMHDEKLKPEKLTQFSLSYSAL
ncbi:hypothetical protein BCR36DRAFT_371744 [Piromyces finnis]|uniref:Mediator of RNA polymerase II transcription subunit 1 n=1 Tax=Piromyces finnis TaxID=1754191 RepID=A0A1Y1V4U0_9FUNG|nr:hypothetical protein BCR36DRAFT_371744 [Piromyces finnis]|eukprot:ORX47259.1 hypothetical protein BCR36DRAFT_371744 [Piromyces finnis]